MTYYYYLKPDNKGYWTLTAPCYNHDDKLLATIDADEMPTQTPFEMQYNQARAIARQWNPYQG